MSGELPRGWVNTTIGEINDYSSCNIDPLKEPEQVFELYSVPIYPTGRPEYVRGQDIGSTKQSVEPGDVLLCKINPRINRVWMVGPKSEWPQIGSSEWVVIRQPLIHAGFLRYQLSESSFREKLCSEVSGVGGSLTRAQPKKVATYSLVLPPAAEQTRIAAKLDELLAQVDTLKARIDGIPALLKRLRQSVLAAAVSGRLTEEWRKKHPESPINLEALSNSPKTRRGVPETVNFPEVLEALQSPETWIWASAAKLLKKGLFIDLKDGNHGANHPKTSEFTAEGLPFITAANVSNSGVIDYLNAPKVSGKALEKLRVGFAEPDDVIFTHKGTVGRVALNSQKCVLTPQTTYYRLSQSAISNQYLSIFLQSNRFQVQTDEIKSQTTRDFIPITAQYELFHLLPPLREQTEIVRRVEQLFAFADQLEAKVTSAKSRIDHLTQSILAKAFRGELVPQDPNDEPASVLLERIKAQRAATPKAKRGRKASA
ncbi:TPA: restriction endonuclease subunit S [Pseudomonas aeruginosa]|nr:restriction endonuclease subunit S [Pseudomonas aeruginosa]HCK7439723.1 restriction endonuclease subunit S [Pseudomonas aeruginosa]